MIKSYTKINSTVKAVQWNNNNFSELVELLGTDITLLQSNPTLYVGENKYVTLKLWDWVLRWDDGSVAKMPNEKFVKKYQTSLDTGLSELLDEIDKVGEDDCCQDLSVTEIPVNLISLSSHCLPEIAAIIGGFADNSFFDDAEKAISIGHPYILDNTGGMFEIIEKGKVQNICRWVIVGPNLSEVILPTMNSNLCGCCNKEPVIILRNLLYISVHEITSYGTDKSESFHDEVDKAMDLGYRYILDCTGTMFHIVSKGVVQNLPNYMITDEPYSNYPSKVEKTLGNTCANGATKNVKDIVFWGDGDLFKLISKASSQNEGWMKSTKAMDTGLGVVIQVTTQQRNPDGSYAIAEALTYVPDAKIVEDASPADGVTSRRIIAAKF